MQVIDGMMMYHLRPWHVYHGLTWEHLTLRIHGLFATNWAFREPLGWKFLLRFTMEGGFGKGLGNDYFSCLFMLCESSRREVCGDSRIGRGWAICRCIIDDHSSHIFNSVIHQTDRMCGIISGGRGIRGSFVWRLRASSQIRGWAVYIYVHISVIIWIHNFHFPYPSVGSKISATFLVYAMLCKV